METKIMLAHDDDKDHDSVTPAVFLKPEQAAGFTRTAEGKLVLTPEDDDRVKTYISSADAMAVEAWFTPREIRAIARKEIAKALRARLKASGNGPTVVVK